MIKKIFSLMLVFVFSVTLKAQESPWLNPNKGQWESNILYKIDLIGGAMFIENDGFAYNLSGYKIDHNHDHEEENHAQEESVNYGVKSTFLNSSWQGELIERDSSEFYRNYILGSDSTKWKSKIYSLRTVELINFYPKIDLVLTSQNEAFKYSFRVKPGADKSVIKIQYEGEDKIWIDEQDNLNIETAVGLIKEKKPYSYYADAPRKEIPSKFNLDNNIVQFNLEANQSTKTLIIDPEITFSTFSGSTSDNWGYTATPDLNGNLFGAGIVSGIGYPVTLGAFDNTYAGGEGGLPWDVGITKFNAEGTALIYSTYFGGVGNETPNSIICNSAGELYVFGVTSSTNLPMTATAFQNSHNGGPVTDENFVRLTGSDLYIARLSANGTSLLSSTYLGGTGVDGVNIGELQKNYGDQYRGEITLDESENVYFSSTTRSINFPTSGANTDNTLSGQQDAIIGKFNSNLSNLMWCTYFGGSGLETGNALQAGSNGSVYITGGTTSTSLASAPGLDQTYNGTIDGYLIKINDVSAAVQAQTYIGTNQYDQGYFVQVDLDNNPYVYGQTNGNMPMSPGVFGNANSGQFIKKFNEDITSELWSTTIGDGSGQAKISPTAFLVSDCYTIYISGWGSTVNNADLPGSTSSGLTTTTDAFQSTTNGNNFYVAVLGENATTLDYATFMGGFTNSPNHVDGGTSRFDKQGRIYHAVCGSCGASNSGFSTTPGAWSNTSNSNNCNMACFKFDLSNIESTIGATEPLICIPNSVTFNNESQNGDIFFWDFGDNSTSNEYSPEHFYSSPGTYEVTLIVGDSFDCFENDTTTIQVVIDEFTGGVVTPPTPTCPGIPYQLEAFGGATYAWSPAAFLDDPTSATPNATINVSTDFTVIVSDVCGSDTLTITLDVYGGNANTTADTSICINEVIDVFATGGGTYEWSPPEGLGATNLANTTASPAQTTTYNVLIITPEGCEINREFTVEVFFDPPLPVLDDTLKLCKFSSEQITASGAQSYSWSPPTSLNTVIGPLVTTSTLTDIEYFVDFTNACGTVPDSIFVDVIEVEAIAGMDTIVCPNYPANVYASGGVSYQWHPQQYVSTPTLDSSVVNAPNPTNYSVVVTDQYGCVDTGYVFVDHFLNPFVQTTPDEFGLVGDEFQLGVNASAPGNFTWSPVEYLSCVNCTNPIANPNESITYTVVFEDKNGCKAQDDINIIFEGIIYVPNTFTPDDNEFNPVFEVKGGNIEEFEMQIFNRWGELIYSFTDFFDSWDGTYNGTKCKDGTYIWKIKYTDVSGEEFRKVGHVNLLR